MALDRFYFWSYARRKLWAKIHPDSGKAHLQNVSISDGGIIDRSINLTINLNNYVFNHKHCHLIYCKQLPCGEIFTVIYC